ncbi:hypothetical protein PU02_0370 [Bartonella ancashensis]|uniref:Uncharacterized protein n=1 Tax=Bartonella ancashensis TaxID=1318743 RepID=A0A0M4LS46_9HYPH|nr:hypothetical protein PU02_0370 [Bartonella ancashensis]
MRSLIFCDFSFSSLCSFLKFTQEFSMKQPNKKQRAPLLFQKS